VSDKSIKMFGYLIGGLGLVGLSRIAPTAAVSLTSVLLVAVLLANTQQFTALTNRLIEALNGDAPIHNPGQRE
jgi:hypothetical protein